MALGMFSLALALVTEVVDVVMASMALFQQPHDLGPWIPEEPVDPDAREACWCVPRSS